MERQLNYEDNIFILNVRIRALSDLLILDADPDIFLEKTLDDLDFIGSTLTLLNERLAVNEQLISWDEMLHNLDETYERFLELLNDMLRGKGCFNADTYPFIRERLYLLASDGAEGQNRVKGLKAASGANTNNARLVGTDELTALLDGI
jgi:hypothetical protein